MKVQSSIPWRVIDPHRIPNEVLRDDSNRMATHAAPPITFFLPRLPHLERNESTNVNALDLIARALDIVNDAIEPVGNMGRRDATERLQ